MNFKIKIKIKINAVIDIPVIAMPDSSIIETLTRYSDAVSSSEEPERGPVFR